MQLWARRPVTISSLRGYLSRREKTVVIQEEAAAGTHLPLTAAQFVSPFFTVCRWCVVGQTRMLVVEGLAVTHQVTTQRDKATAVSVPAIQFLWSSSVEGHA